MNSAPDNPAKTLGEWLQSEPFRLVMSAGFFGFFAHAGMLAALESSGIRPAAVSGSSAGALVAGAWASGRSAAEVGDRLCAIERRDFWDPAPGYGLLRGALFRGLLHDTLAAHSFEACRTPVSMSAWEVRSRRTHVFESGDLAAAVHASCCFPGLLQPVTIGGRRYLDGGIADRAALAGVSADERVFHHHLSSRSPWRSRQSPALAAPSRRSLTALVIDGLPRSSPFHLDRGPAAYECARRATLRALDQPVVDGLVRLDAGGGA